MPGIITLTTDFGPGAYVGAMKGAILSIDEDLTIVDVDHQVRPHDVRHGAFVLYSSVPYYPFAVHVGVVDPGVGTKRRWASSTPGWGRNAGRSCACAKGRCSWGRTTAY